MLADAANVRGFRKCNWIPRASIDRSFFCTELNQSVREHVSHLRDIAKDIT